MVSFRRVSAFALRSAGLKFGLFALALVTLLLSVAASAQQTFTGAAVAVSRTQTTASNGVITISGATGSSIATLKIVLNGLTTDGTACADGNCWSLLPTSFYLQAPHGGPKLVLLGGTGDGIDGDDAVDAGSGLNNATITIQDGASPAPNGNPWSPKTGTFTVEPSSYFLGAGQTPPLGSEADFPQSDGTATLSSKFAGIGIANGDQWTLTIENGEGLTTPINISSWQMIVTYASTTPTTTSVSSNVNPAFTTTPSNSITLTATVTSSGTPTGTVAFTDNGNTIGGCGAAVLSGGETTCNTTLAQGYHTIEAAYSGGGGFGQSSGSYTELVEVHPAQSGNTWCNNTSFSTPLNGTGIVYPAVIPVSGYSPGATVGNVTVELEGVTEPTELLSEFLLVAPGGNNNLDFLDSAFHGAGSSTTLFISDSASTSPAYGSPVNNGTYLPFDGQTQSIDAFPASNSPIVDNNIPSVPGSINYAATYGKTNALTLQQAFSGAPANGDWALYATASNGSTALTVGGWCVTLDVNSGVGTTTSLSSNAQKATKGSNVTLTATVTVQGSSTPVTSGTVEFTDETTGAVLASSNPLDGSGVATVTVSNFAEGDHKILASYSGTGSFNTSFANLYQRIDDASAVTNLGGNQWQVCNTGAITIPAGTSGAETPNPSNIFVPNLPGTLKTATLTLTNFSILVGDQLDNTASLVVGPTGTALDFFSNTAGGTIEDEALAGNYVFADSAGGLVPSGSGNLNPGTYKPTSYVGTINANDVFTADLGGFYTLPGSFGYSASRGTSTFANEFGGISPVGTWSLYFSSPNANINGTGAAGGWCMNITENAPTVSVTKAHGGDFSQGQTNAAFTVDIDNNGTTGPTGDPSGSSPMTVTDTLNAAFTYSTFSGTNWSCSAAGQVVTCTNDSAIAQGSNYPTLTINVNVASNAPTSVTNQVTVIGAGVASTSSNTDTVTIDQPPAITSGNNTTFTVATPGTFTVTTTGLPTPSISENGALPSGVTFTDNGNGTATLTGIPAAGTGGTYAFTITASNTASPNATQNFTLTVNQAPAITSAAGATFSAGTLGTFTLTATGNPAPTFSETGALPTGVTLSSAGVLSGTPAFGTGGTYNIVVTATNSVNSAQQSFALTIQEPPAITSASATSFNGGAPSTFTVTTTGSPAPAIGETGALPTGVTFTDNGNGTATLAGTPTDGGSFPITITANNGVAPPANQNFTLTVTQYALTTSANPAAGGTITPASGSTYNPGTVVPVAATPATGYTFVRWSSAPDAVASATSASTTITMNAPESVTAQFAPILVVNTPVDDAGLATNCTAQTAPGSNTVDTACSLRDALLNAAAAGAGSITFDSTVFSAPSTITLSNGTLTLPVFTSITGPTSGNGATLANLVTVDGGGATNNSPAFTVNGQSATESIANLIITHAVTDAGTGAGIVNGFGSALTVMNSTISQNSATAGTGGIFNDFSATLTLIGSTVANNSGGIGGIVNESGGTVTITNSTITGNSASSSGGGVVNDNGILTVTASTISGNSATFDAGGILSNNGGTFTLANSIVSLNTAATNPDIDGTPTDNGGNQIGAAGISLSSLNSFGGPTQTLVPLPGSPALCGGLASNASAANLTTDQRGMSFNPACPSGTVDSGAVQTNYAIFFSTQPPAHANAGAPMSPAPVVTLTESGVVFTPAASGVGIIDTDNSLSASGTNTVALSSGTATFSNVIFSSAESFDTLIAFLVLNPNLSPQVAVTSQQSTSFDVAGLAVMISPTPGLKTVLPSTNVTFQWSSGAGVTEYQLSLGTTGPGSFDLATFKGTDTSTTIGTMPANGVTVYARLLSYINGKWLFNDYVYTESPAPVPAAITAPTPGLSTILGASNVPFQWTTGTAVTLYQLNLGTIAPGSHDLFMYKGSNTSTTVPSLPATGQIVYARLYSLINKQWVYTDYQYTESGSTSAGVLTSPAPGTTTPLGTTNVTFQWTTGTGVDLYQLNLGTVPGAHDVFEYKGSATSVNVPTLPANGQIVYARLFSRINGTWMYNDYTYFNNSYYGEGGSAVPAALTSPTPGLGTVLGTSNVPFQWTTGTGVTLYQLTLSTIAPGASELFQYKGAAVTTTVPTLPSNGATVYARLFSFINGAWQHNDYVYSESGAPAKAVLTSPTPGLATELGNTDVQFQWTAGVAVTDYQLNLSAVAPGQSELFIYKGTSTTATAPTLPRNGVTVYARLYSRINGAWQFNDYVYTEFFNAP